MSVVYNPWNEGLGDRWATFNLLMALARQRNSPVLLHSTGHRARLNAEIIDSLAEPGWIVATDRPATHHLSGYDVWAAPSAPTRHRWHPSAPHGLVCCHFDGISSATDKNPNAHEHAILMCALRASGFEVAILNRHQPIAEVIAIMCASAFFVGVDSGFSHIAHSVGLPTFLLEFELPIITCHRGKSFIQCGSRHEGRYAVEEFLRWKLPTHVDLLRFIGHPDGERSTVPRDRSHRDALDRAGSAWWAPNAHRSTPNG